MDEPIEPARPASPTEQIQAELIEILNADESLLGEVYRRQQAGETPADIQAARGATRPNFVKAVALTPHCKRRRERAIALTVLAGVVIVGACGGSSPPRASTQSPTTSVQTSSVGQQVYAERCAVCHGAHGQGGPGARLAGGAAASRYPSVEAEETVVRDGAAAGTMPAFKDILTPEQIRAVVAYTRSL